VVIQLNLAAETLFKEDLLDSNNVTGLISQSKDINISEFIDNNDSLILTEEVKGSVYSFLFRGVSELEVCQIYGSDITELKNAETEILHQKKEIENQRDEILAQRDVATEQRDKIITQKEEIESSIEYASRIQNAILPSEEFASLLFEDHFILFKPRDIVSGDFYWYTHVDELSIMAIADCTGHGVPGAFMSMLGVAFLDEIINKAKITRPDLILNQLKKYVIESLSQDLSVRGLREGMDIAIVAINKEQQILQYAGANNPLYAISKDKNDNGVLTEIKSDRQPISIYPKMKDFTLQEIPYSNGDIFYLFSDGYADQFGGERDGKFKSQRLKDLLISISYMPLCDQKQRLDIEFDSWRGDNFQIDDVVIAGVKL